MPKNKTQDPGALPSGALEHRAREAAEELRQATREAHEAVKGLRQAEKDVRSLLAECSSMGAQMKKILEDDCRDIVFQTLQKQLEGTPATVLRAVEESRERIIKSFNHLESILLGEDKETLLRRGGNTISTMVELAVERGKDLGISGAAFLALRPKD